ncbi:hypothetical protein GCM10009557_22830 [Virgisporangium ochraceum]|uniref:Uncharacterized protein n=1 Tax=Virgisporangium ochraceum TaxID=65505 RepID=A0A8J4A3F7_9ACTN|nr:hypothetical protein [Virgisporangium ochraceum]GIJ75149.1 hypothetical protein Voc01_100660 [Virgisporangium ochraceum]
MTVRSPVARPVATPVEAPSLRRRIGAAAHRRAGRLEWIVFALAVLVVPLIILLLGGD